MISVCSHGRPAAQLGECFESVNGPMPGSTSSSRSSSPTLKRLPAQCYTQPSSRCSISVLGVVRGSAIRSPLQAWVARQSPPLFEIDSCPTRPAWRSNKLRAVVAPRLISSSEPPFPCPMRKTKGHAAVAVRRRRIPRRSLDRPK